MAFEEAEAAALRGEVPVGAVITDQSGQIIAAAGNRTIELADPTAHAEILAIRKACKALSSERLTGLDLYVTLEPCNMCAAAISFARIRRLYYGCDDEKMGGRGFFHSSQCHHAPEIYDGIGAQRSAQILRGFFRNRR